jgi:hypothetical protein
VRRHRIVSITVPGINIIVARVRHDSEILGSSSDGANDEYDEDFVDDGESGDDEVTANDGSNNANNLADIASSLKLLNTYEAEHGLIILLQNCPHTKAQVKKVDNDGVTIEWHCTKFDDEFLKKASFVDNFPPLAASLYDDIKEPQSVFISCTKPLNPNHTNFKIVKNEDLSCMMVCIPYNPEATQNDCCIGF